MYNLNMGIHPFSEFILFIIVVLFRKRIFLHFLLLGLVVFIVQLLVPGFSLPWGYYLAFLLAGFTWSAFHVDRDLSKAYRELSSQYLIKNSSKSDLVISPVHGNEYEFSISDPYDGKNIHMTKLQNTKGMKCHYDERGIFYINDAVYYVMAKGNLEINLQIQNSGKQPLDILSIDLYDNLDLSHLRYFNEGIFRHGSRLQYPFRLESGEHITLKATYGICINNGSNPALFAADFQSLPRSIRHEISVNAKDTQGKRQSIASAIKVPTKPLLDLYAKQWQEYDQTEYLVLSGYSPAGKM